MTTIVGGIVVLGIVLGVPMLTMEFIVRMGRA